MTLTLKCWLCFKNGERSRGTLEKTPRSVLIWSSFVCRKEGFSTRWHHTISHGSYKICPPEYFGFEAPFQQ